MTTTVKTATMEAATKVLFVKAQLGTPCHGALPYFFTCPSCDEPFCSKCYKLSPTYAGAAICPTCEEVLYFASASKKSNAESSKPGGCMIGN